MLGIITKTQSRFMIFNVVTKAFLLLMMIAVLFDISSQHVPFIAAIVGVIGLPLMMMFYTIAGMFFAMYFVIAIVIDIYLSATGKIKLAAKQN